jgi:transketolase N-terminal domain/subunit
MKSSAMGEAGISKEAQVSRLKQLANEIRFSALTMNNHSQLGHTGGS